VASQAVRWVFSNLLTKYFSTILSQERLTYLQKVKNLRTFSQSAPMCVRISQEMENTSPDSICWTHGGGFRNITLSEKEQNSLRTVYASGYLCKKQGIFDLMYWHHRLKSGDVLTRLTVSKASNWWMYKITPQTPLHLQPTQSAIKLTGLQCHLWNQSISIMFILICKLLTNMSKMFKAIIEFLCIIRCLCHLVFGTRASQHQVGLIDLSLCP
jgi:hypothetical protein